MKYENSADVLADLEAGKVVYKNDVVSWVLEHLIKLGFVGTYKYEDDLEVVVLTEEYKKSME